MKKYLLLPIFAIGLFCVQQVNSQCATGTVSMNFYNSTGGSGTYSDPATGFIEYGFCFTPFTFFEKSTNWMHGIYVSWSDIPSGVSIIQGLTGVQPTQHGSRTWIFVDSLKARQLGLPGLGYFVDDGDGNPTNNYGDNGLGTPNASFPDLSAFCFEATYNCGAPTLLRPVITVSGDGTTGAWKNPACPGDVIKATKGGPLNDGILIVCGLVLPLELLSFEGYNKDGINYLFWSGIADNKFSHYELEKREYASNDFTKLDNFVIPASTKENSAHFISSMDVNLSKEINYYRLKMIELDNTFEYSKTISLRNSIRTVGSVEVFPNPIDDLVYIQFPNTSTPLNYTIELLNIHGLSIMTQSISVKGSNYEHKLDVNSLNAGVYFLKLKSENEFSQMFKLLKK